MSEIIPPNGLFFGTTGNYQPYAVWGWHQSTEEDHTWIDGNMAILRFKVPAVSTICRTLMATLWSCRIDVPQQVFVYLNGYFVGFAASAPYQDVELVLQIDERFFRKRKDNDLTFVTPNAVAPSSFGRNDERRLSYALVRLELIPAWRKRA